MVKTLKGSNTYGNENDFADDYLLEAIGDVSQILNYF